MASLLIRGGRVFDGERFTDADVFVNDNVVEQIGTSIDAEAKIVFDAQGMTVLPGLIDGHMHIRGFSMDKWGAPAQAACWPFGIAPHTWQATAAAGSNLGAKGALYAAKILAATGYELLTNPAKTEEIIKEYKDLKVDYTPMYKD